MLRTFSFSLVVALCLTVAMPMTSYALRSVDDYQADGGGGGRPTRPVPNDPVEPTQPTQPTQPTEPTEPTQPDVPQDTTGPIVVPQDVPTIGGLVQHIVQVADKTLQSAANLLDEYIALKGGRLPVDTTDVLINDYPNICRWIDNTSSTQEYFVPLGSESDWQAFVNNGPSAVTRATCCPAATLTLTASDGQFALINLPIGREGSTGPNGLIDVSQAFGLTRAADGATWTETVSDAIQCQDGAWTSTGLSRDSDVPPITPDEPPVGDDPVPAPSCMSGFNPAADFEGTSDGVDTDNTFPVTSFARVYYTAANTMTITVNGVSHPMTNVSRDGNALYGEYISEEFTVAAKIRNMHQAYRYVTWGGRNCVPVPPTAPVVRIDSPDCRTAAGVSYGACAWNGDGDDRMDFPASNHVWDDVAFACARAGYKYFVAGAGSDYDDCSHCSWALWTDNTAVSTPIAGRNGKELPAATAPSWGVTRRGSWTNGGGLRQVWCSNAPSQHVPYDCAPQDGVVVATQKAVRKQTGRTSTTTLVPATFTTNLPGGYVAVKQRWEVYSPVHPDDTETSPSSRRNDAHLRLVPGVLQPQGLPAENIKRYAECTPTGWKLYGSCIVRGVRGTTQPGNLGGGPGSATCSDAVTPDEKR